MAVHNLCFERKKKKKKKKKRERKYTPEYPSFTIICNYSYRMSKNAFALFFVLIHRGHYKNLSMQYTDMFKAVKTEKNLIKRKFIFFIFC